MRTTAANFGGSLENPLLAVTASGFDLVLRLRTGAVGAEPEFRDGVDTLLRVVERDALAHGYLERQARSAVFVLAAFVDEIVLTTSLPMRDEWEKNPLQLEYFGEHLAGVTWFDRLASHLEAGADDLDVVEIYYLALLLGFKGKYKVYLEDELQGVVADVADFLRRANRLRVTHLSPHWKSTDEVVARPAEPAWPRWIKVAGPSAAGALLVLYLVLLALLQSSITSAVEEHLLR